MVALVFLEIKKTPTEAGVVLESVDGFLKERFDGLTLAGDEKYIENLVAAIQIDADP